ILQDIVKFPSLASALKSAEGANLAVSDLFNRVVIRGGKGRLVLQDIDGNVLIQTSNNLQGAYTDEPPWLESILDGSIAYHFQILGQNQEYFTFQMSIPVTYDSGIAGVLSAEITVDLSQILVTQALNKNVAFRISQEQRTIYTEFGHIEIAREHSINLDSPALTFTYITDDGPLRAEARYLRNTILTVLLIGLAISFILFALLGYRSLVNNDKTLKMKRSIWLAYAVPILVGVIGVGASIAALLIILNIQKSSLELKLIADSKATVQSLREKVNTNLHTLDFIRAFYDASSEVSRLDFKIFSLPLLESSQNIQAVEWAPHVQHNNRGQYELQARRDGIADFGFTEEDKNGQLVASKNQADYFPVYFVEPLIGNEQAVGFDQSSNDKRFSAMLQARDSGQKVATANVILGQGTGSQVGILLFYAIYNNVLPMVDVESRQSQLRGFVVLVLKTEDMIRSSMSYEQYQQTMLVQDITEANSIDVIFGAALENSAFSRSEILEVAGRSWQVTTYSNLFQTSIWWVSWLVFISGIVFTGLIVVVLVNLIRRREVVELLVAKRTAELRVLSSTVAHSNDVFIITEAHDLNLSDGGPRITYVNDAFTRLTGYLSKEAIGNTPSMLQGPKTDRNELDKMRIALENGETYLGEVINYSKSGEEYWVEVNLSALKDIEGNITHFAAVQRDITGRKQAQKEREQMVAQLIDSNEELERFAFVCSHDIQEPLRMICSFSEKLENHIAKTLELDEKGAKYLHFVTDGATRAQVLVTDILAYSSIATSTQQLEDVKVDDFIKIIKVNMQNSLQDNGGCITYDPLPTLRGNKTQLFQLFQNLINNGMKYCQTDTPPQVHISVKDAGELWQFAIKDNGIGIEQRHLKKIFEVFQRLHRKSQYAGTGVGLSICKKVVERHGGSIWVESEKGTGSTFYFTLLKPTLTEERDETKH
ncbi:MAG: CHASE domain-containing protein, partial [Paraglaciecola sp.]|nr:CHASE domain-containing protein [Paraglaciecola sp.]